YFATYVFAVDPAHACSLSTTVPHAALPAAALPTTHTAKTAASARTAPRPLARRFDMLPSFSRDSMPRPMTITARRLPSARAEGTGRLDRIRCHVPHAPLHQPLNHRKGVEDAGDDARHDRDGHQVDEGNDVDELRKRLQDVVDRPEHPRDDPALGGPHTQRE